MLKTLSSGGLGDAAMAYAKLVKFDDEINHTHVMLNNKLLKPVADFFDSQKIKSKVIQIPNLDWKIHNRKKFDIILDVYADNKKKSDSIEINPFPGFNIGKKDYQYDIVISPSSGRDNERFFTINEIYDFIRRTSYLKTVLIGTENNGERFDGLGVHNLINKTNIGESIDIISSCKYVITPSGFVSFIGCMLNKCVFTKENRHDIRRIYYHKKWNNVFINNLNIIEIYD
jgi:hypothetical protein